MNSSEAVGCLARRIREGGRMDPAPEPVLLMADGFGEFVRLIGGTDVPVGVESLSVIIRSSPNGLGNRESCLGAAIDSW